MYLTLVTIILRSSRGLTEKVQNRVFKACQKTVTILIDLEGLCQLANTYPQPFFILIIGPYQCDQINIAKCL